MGGVRPVTTTFELDPDSQDVPRDMWILARSKIKYYGAYPPGFLERARPVLGAKLEDSVWHIPGGMAHTYNGAGGIPTWAYGPNDLRIDLDPEVEPDILMDVRRMHSIIIERGILRFPNEIEWCKRPKAIIIDLPYSAEEANKYFPGPAAFPSLQETLKQSLRIVEEGGLVGVLDWMWPRGKSIGAKCIFCATVTTGEGSRSRLFTVWKKA